MNYHTRWLIRHDMPTVLEIERLSFDNPWDEADFVRCLRQRTMIGMVAEHEERVVGFMIYELHRRTLVLIDLAVHPDFRRRGVGRQLIGRLLSKLSHQRRNRLSVIVSDHNLPAHLFFRAIGMRASDIVRDYFEDAESGECRDGYFFSYTVREEVPV